MGKEFSVAEIKEALPTEENKNRITWQEFYDRYQKKLRGWEFTNDEGDYCDPDAFIEHLWYCLPDKVKAQEPW